MKILEKPVIAMDTGKVLGSLKGLIYTDTKIQFLYCRLSDRYVYIPVEDVSIGSDAIMLKSTEDINILRTDGQRMVYSTKGKKLGIVTSIEITEDFKITGIFVNDLFIEIDKILHMEDIIIVVIDKVDKNDTNNAEAEEEQINLINQQWPIEASPTSTDHQENSTKEDEVVSSDSEDQSTTKIDPRYNYLVGKKLLEDITVADKTYKKDTTIDVSLIESAINHNSIVKVIMNTED